MNPPTIEHVSIKSVALNPDNPRQISSKQFERLVKSLEDRPDLFEARPLLCSDRTGKLVVIGGNMRLRAAQKLGYKEVPVIILRGLDLRAEKEIAIKDNGGFGEWDFDVLANEWSDLPLAEWGVDVPDDWGPDPSESADAEPQIDKAAELNKKWQVKTGDLFQIGDHRLLCGDSTKREDVARVMGQEKAAIMNTDPPYGVDYGDIANSRDRAANKKNGGDGKVSRDQHITNDDLNADELQSFLESVIRTAIPHLIDNPAFYLWHPMLTQGTFFAAAAAADILIHRQIVWVKPSLIMGRGDYHWRHELCFYGWIKGKRCVWLRGRDQDTVWEIGREGDGSHPTMKPVELFNRPLLNHTKEGDVAYEPFSGSGPQFVACQNLSRKCYGIEISPNYCAVILERMASAFPGIEIKRIEQ